MNDTTQVSFARLFPQDWPRAGEELRQLLASAAASGLETVDVYTIRDLQELSGCDDEALCALLVCLFLALHEGSVCQEASAAALTQRLDGMLDEQRARAWAEGIIEGLDQNRFEALIGGDDGEPKPVIRQTVRGRTLLYFQKYLKHERALQELLRQRLRVGTGGGATSGTRLGELRGILADVIAEHAAAGIRLGDDQKLAIGLALLRDFAVISGGPGTGKTTIVSALLHCLLRSGVPASRVALCCPTGRAAQRLTESLRAASTRLGSGARDSRYPLFGEQERGGEAPAAQTIHRLLGYNPASGMFAHHRENPLAADVLVVDEASMVDVVLMSRLLGALAPGTAIVLLGDKDQLPSVDAGAVLADLMPKDGQARYSDDMRKRLRALTGVTAPASSAGDAALADTIVVLKENYRSQQHITGVAREINELGATECRSRAEQIVARLPRLKLATETAGTGEARYVWPVTSDGGCYMLDHAHETRVWQAVLDAWARHHYVDSAAEGATYPQLIEQAEAPDEMTATPEQGAAIQRVFAVVNGARVLTLVREGPWGCDGVNGHIARLLMPPRDRHSHGGLFAGVPVLVTANDYTQQLFNGDVGVALRNRHGQLRVVFERQDEAGRRGHMALPVDVLPNHQLAFAMTVHKSQGSEYGQVLLALPPEGARELQNRQLVYTAITRARNMAVCYGTAAGLSAALSRALVRCSGLDLV